MTKLEFLTTLGRLLADIDPQECTKAILFYDENISDKIEDGMTEQEAVASLGDVHDIAAELVGNIPLKTLVQAKIQTSRNNASNKTVWVVLAICGFPIWLPLLLSFFVVILAVYICIWAVVISLFAALLSLLLSGVALLLSSFVLWPTNPFSGSAAVAAGLFITGLFLLCVRPIWLFSKQLVACTSVLLRKIKSKFISHKEVRV